jgi:hypothetical protein
LGTGNTLTLNKRIITNALIEKLRAISDMPAKSGFRQLSRLVPRNALVGSVGGKFPKSRILANFAQVSENTVLREDRIGTAETTPLKSTC